MGLDWDWTAGKMRRTGGIESVGSKSVRLETWAKRRGPVSGGDAIMQKV